MLGSQSWYTALAVPTIVIGGFVATRKRLAYQWREELMDPDGTSYPTVTDAEMEFFRRVAPATAVEAAVSLATGQKVSADAAATVAEAYGVPLTAQDNIGMNVRSDVLPPEMRNVLLNEVQRWSQSLGDPLDQRKVDAIERHLQAAMAGDALLLESGGAASLSSAPISQSMPSTTSETTLTTVSDGSGKPWLSFDFLRSTRIIADHAEDIQPMKAPWGCGDRMRLEQMPASLRYLVRHTQQAFEGMGRLRHVYVEYAPTGQFYRVPRPPKMYDGHDYVVIPLRRDGRDTVLTMSPVLRSRVSDLREVALHSWTSRDVDALVPAGCMLRVYGTARYEWGWGIRPGAAWFGSRLNRVALNGRTGQLAATGEVVAPQRWSWQRLTQPISSLFRGGGCSSGGGASRQKSDRLSAPLSSAPSDAALIVLHFEGPRSNGKQRSLLLQPEIWIFGQPPSVETYETWYEDRPTADSVKAEGVLRFMIRNYFDMLTVS